jgi:hypothetical protein
MTMLFAPQLLESLAGTAIVFGIAAVLVGVVLALDRIVSMHHHAPT